jgi:anti-anti-sigma factor
MPMTAVTDKEGKVLKISITGRFDYSMHRDFREAYRNYSGTGIEYRVNLSGTEYMDSSALGMLLLLREHAGGDHARIVIERPSDVIRKILEIANFHQLFTIA